MAKTSSNLATVTEAGRRLGVSESTIWRLIRRGALPSVRRAGRRLVPASALEKQATARDAEAVPPLDESHPIFRLVGAGRSGGVGAGARDKHAILDE